MSWFSCDTSVTGAAAVDPAKPCKRQYNKGFKPRAQAREVYCMPIRDLKAQIARLPEQPGVYLYYNEEGETLYVGKARVLRDRVRSYLGAYGMSPRIDALLDEAHRLETIITDSVVEALALESHAVSAFGGFWDSVIDRFSDISLFIGLIYLYSDLRRTDYVMVTALAMMFAIMTSYTRARAESIIKKCKVGFMERPERIVLFMIGAFTNRMAAVMWVILVLSIFTVADRIILTYRELRETHEAIA